MKNNQFKKGGQAYEVSWPQAGRAHAKWSVQCRPVTVVSAGPKRIVVEGGVCDAYQAVELPRYRSYFDKLPDFPGRHLPDDSRFTRGHDAELFSEERHAKLFAHHLEMAHKARSALDKIGDVNALSFEALQAIIDCLDPEKE